jgi:hypothetical protein
MGEKKDVEEKVNGTGPVVTVESTYRTTSGEKTETFTLDVDEVENLLELALRDSLDSVDARVIADEIRARSIEE